MTMTRRIDVEVGFNCISLSVDKTGVTRGIAFDAIYEIYADVGAVYCIPGL
jgi:hypothetical protein